MRWQIQHYRVGKPKKFYKKPQTIRKIFESLNHVGLNWNTLGAKKVEKYNTDKNTVTITDFRSYSKRDKIVKIKIAKSK